MLLLFIAVIIFFTHYILMYMTILRSVRDDIMNRA